MDFVTALDTEILWRIQALLQSPSMDKVMMFFSFLGDNGGIWIVIALLLLIDRRTRRIGLTMGLAMLLVFLAGNLGLKPLLARPRPITADPSVRVLVPYPPGDPYSFPSGHAMNSMAAATALGSSRRSWGGVAVILAAVICFSRLYLMLHYPTDVLGGIIVGAFGGMLAHLLIDRLLPVADPQRAKKD